jgi:rubrerythrin
MSKAPSGHKISNLTDLLAIAYRIEADAVERYKLLADQMETHNNPDLVKVFKDLARAEGIHAEEIRKMGEPTNLVEHADRLGAWPKGESPEEVDMGAATYDMTVWDALQLALAGEQRALDFYKSILETAKDSKIKEFASEFVEEEAEHVNLVYRLMRKYPKPDSTWTEDGDPPVAQG